MATLANLVADLNGLRAAERSVGAQSGTNPVAHRLGYLSEPSPRLAGRVAPSLIRLFSERCVSPRRTAPFSWGRPVDHVPVRPPAVGLGHRGSDLKGE